MVPLFMASTQIRPTECDLPDRGKACQEKPQAGPVERGSEKKRIDNPFLSKYPFTIQ
jgi:hypothetical protein